MLAVFLAGNIFSKQLFQIISMLMEASHFSHGRGGETAETVSIPFVTLQTCGSSSQSDARNLGIAFCPRFSEAERVMK